MVIGKLLREKYQDKQTIGTFYLYDGEDIVFKCKTLELPWKNNAKRISCIPKGSYDCILVQNSPSFNYAHYNVQDVPGRAGVKIHAGNYYTNIKGCLLFGKAHVDINKDGYVDVTSTRETLNELIEKAGKRFTLSVENSKNVINEIDSNNNLDSSPSIIGNPWNTPVSE